MKKLPFLKKKTNVLKMRLKTNTNKTSACSMPYKVPSSVNLQNLFISLMVTKESSFENESQV